MWWNFFGLDLGSVVHLFCKLISQRQVACRVDRQNQLVIRKHLRSENLRSFSKMFLNHNFRGCQYLANDRRNLYTQYDLDIAFLDILNIVSIRFSQDLGLEK